MYNIWQKYLLESSPAGQPVGLNIGMMFGMGKLLCFQSGSGSSNSMCSCVCSLECAGTAQVARLPGHLDSVILKLSDKTDS